MATGWVTVIAALALTTGCAHVRRVGRPPSPDEVEKIDGSASRESGTFAIHYFDPSKPCGGGACTVDGPRPVFDVPPSEIERIDSIEAGQLTVVARAGAVWHLDLSKVAGVTTHHRATLSGGIVGGGVGLSVGALVALFASGGPFPDAPLLSEPPSGRSSTSVAIMATSTVVGALVGVLVGHAVFARDSFEFGETGLSSEPSSEFGR